MPLGWVWGYFCQDADREDFGDGADDDGAGTVGGGAGWGGGGAGRDAAGNSADAQGDFAAAAGEFISDIVIVATFLDAPGLSRDLTSLARSVRCCSSFWGLIKKS